VITNPVDDESRSVGIANDTAERFPDLVQVWSKDPEGFKAQLPA
jgi:hypothetical protein